MKILINKLLPYVGIGLLFNGIIVYIYDGNIENMGIILEGTLLFTMITVLMERLMYLFYVKYKIEMLLRVSLTVIVGLVLFTGGVWLTKPWLVDEVWHIPVFVRTMLPMFVSSALLVEWYFQKISRTYNGQLDALKKQKQRIE